MMEEVYHYAAKPRRHFHTKLSGVVPGVGARPALAELARKSGRYAHVRVLDGDGVSAGMAEKTAS